MRAALILIVALAGCSDTTTPVDGPRREGLADLGRDAIDQRGEARSEMRADVASEGLKVDLAPGTGPLRVGTLNLHCLFENPDTRAQGIANEIKAHDLDAMALQEICETVGSPGDNMGGKLTAALKTTTGVDWEVHWAQTHVSWSGKYNEGIGVIARKGAFLSFGEQSLTKGDDFQRKVFWGKISTARGAFYLYSTHLTISSVWQQRLQQVKDILAVVNTHLPDNLPQIVAGDFNDKDWSGPLQAMVAGPPAFTDAMKAKHPTNTPGSFGCPNPPSADRIDFLMIRTAALKSLSTVEQLAQQYQGICLSDHVGLWAEFFQN
jgi:endonuclease/exonuclease/phosphatase family metal-dependent hydrolase